jgi:molybdate transport system substrate-binding protein
MRRALAVLAAALVLAAAVNAEAAEVKVLSAGAMRAVLQQLGAKFEAVSGDRLSVEYATAGGVEKQIASGAPFDVAILTRPRIKELASQGKIADTKVLAGAPIGLAVRAGMKRPDIGTVAAFKEALLHAKSLAYTDPASGGTSGIHIAHVLDQLGIAGELKPKVRLVGATPGHGSPLVGEVVAKGEAELGIQPISELMAVKGIDIVGPLPASLQSPDLVYVAGVPKAASQPGAAKRLIEFLAGANAAPVYRSKGMQPQ